MKVTFLGTSHGVPGVGRHSTSIMIEAGDGRYIIDGGAPLAGIFIDKNLDPETVKAFFITHMHGDHINGAIELFDLMNWYYKKADPDIYLPQANAAPAIENWFSVLYGGEPPRHLKYKMIEPGLFYSDDNIKVTAIPTDHLVDRPSYAFKIEGDERSVLITSDLSSSGTDFPELAFTEDIDMIISEAAHIHLVDMVDKLSKCKTGLFAITHVFPQANSDEDIEKFILSMPIKCVKVNDGDSFEL